MIEVYAHMPDEGKVVITYLNRGYRLPIPMIDAEVHSVSKEVERAFVSGSMWGWDAPVAMKAHEYVALAMLPTQGTA